MPGPVISGFPLQLYTGYLNAVFSFLPRSISRIPTRFALIGRPNTRLTPGAFGSKRRVLFRRWVGLLLLNPTSGFLNPPNSLRKGLLPTVLWGIPLGTGSEPGLNPNTHRVSKGSEYAEKRLSRRAFHGALLVLVEYPGVDPEKDSAHPNPVFQICRKSDAIPLDVRTGDSWKPRRKMKNTQKGRTWLNIGTTCAECFM